MSPDAIATTAGSALSEPEAKRLLATAGFAVPHSVVVRHRAAADLTGLRPPFAVKVMSPAILHKSDAGGVRLGLQDAGGVAAAIAAMRRLPAIAAARAGTFLVEEMARPGTEIVIGGLRDEQFGPAVMVGLAACSWRCCRTSPSGSARSPRPTRPPCWTSCGPRRCWRAQGAARRWTGPRSSGRCWPSAARTG